MPSALSDPKCIVRKWEVVVDILKHLVSGYLFAVLLKPVYMFSLCVLFCHVVQGKCIILHNTSETFGMCERGGPGRLCIPTRLSWVGEVKCFSMVCVGGDHPLTRGSLEPLRHICLYSNWYSLAHQYEAFLQSEHSSQTQVPQVFGSS